MYEYGTNSDNYSTHFVVQYRLHCTHTSHEDYSVQQQDCEEDDVKCPGREYHIYVVELLKEVKTEFK